MIRYVALFFILIFFTACESTVSTSSQSGVEGEIVDINNFGNKTAQSQELTNNEYIDSIPNDTTKVNNLAKVPHNKHSIPMLGILVSYDNIKITSSDTVWSAKLFGKSEHQLNNYYLEVSNNNFEFEKARESDGISNDGIVSVSLNKNHPDVDIDKYSFDSLTHPDLKDALITVDEKIDFSNYDSNADGYITPDELLLTFIIAGYEDSYEGYHVKYGTWGHQSCTDYTNTPTLDGVSLMGCSGAGNYAMFGEKHNARDPYDATIGIIAHELGHSAFSLPDLYNTSGYEGGIGSFGLMGAGVWTRQNSSEHFGNTPTHFTAWSKVYMGWVTPIEESGSTTLIETASSSYNIIKIPISANHYYLLENRNNSGYDKGLYSLDGVFNGGIAIWHINENKLTNDNFWANNVNNDTENKGVDLVEAQNTNIDTYSDGGEKALFYSPVTTAFGTKVTNISSRGSVMNLNIN